MVVWKGWGILVALFAFAVFFMIGQFAPATSSDTSGNENLLMGIGLIFTVVPIWFLGRYLNQKQSGKTFVDKESGEEFKLGPQHTFFFLRMEYWAPIFLILGLIMTVTSLFD